MRSLPVITAALALSTLSLAPRAARAGELDPDRDSLARTTPEQLRNGDDSQLRFLAYFITRGEVTNVAPTNDLLQGRVVGRLFGPNTTTTSQGTSWLIEQRRDVAALRDPAADDRLLLHAGAAGFDGVATAGQQHAGGGGGEGDR